MRRSGAEPTSFTGPVVACAKHPQELSIACCTLGCAGTTTGQLDQSACKCLSRLRWAADSNPAAPTIEKKA